MEKLTQHKTLLFIFLFCISFCASAADYTVLNATEYQQTINYSREKIQKLIVPYKNLNDYTAFLAKQLSDIPYLREGSMGEGDWQPDANDYQPGAVHIQQDPVYRLDGLDCQTLVQVTMALLHSKSLKDFDKNILKISYGAAGPGQGVHYYNRNNFVDGDFNPINQQNGFLVDVTTRSPYAKKTTAILTRQNWFKTHQQNLRKSVRVLSEHHGPDMVDRFKTLYSHLTFPHFNKQTISISYFPKELIALSDHRGGYQPNQTFLASLPTPAVIEIVRDAKQWRNDQGVKIKDELGSELNISHLGLLYRQRFKKHELIYQKIVCTHASDPQKNCQVKPIFCQKDRCDELMFVHATESHPDSYFWYQTSPGHYACSPQKPRSHYTFCNRVERTPLFDYLTDYQYGSYWYMNTPSLLGIHVEKLTA